MSINKKNLIVTLTDANFINQAKQLFASVYFKAGWQGDYLLLACGLSDEDKVWFKTKGILVYDCQPLSNQPVGSKKYPPIVLSKYYLFKEYFKQWQRIIFLDADIMVRSSLDELLKVVNFGAVSTTFALRDEFFWNDWLAVKKLKNKYKLNGQAFNSGVFIFNTDLITETTFDEIISLQKEFDNLSVHGEEAVLNLYFYKKWTELSIIYNSMPFYMDNFYKLNESNLRAVVVHFVNSVKPWTNPSPYFLEWSDNFKNADRINLNQRLVAEKFCPELELTSYLKYLRRIDIIKSWRKSWLFIDSQLGQLGLFIKYKNSKFYKLINFQKND